MEVDQDEDILRKVAAGLPMDYARWPTLLEGVLTRLDNIARHEFPIPNLPPPPRPVNPPGNALPTSSTDPIASQSSSQEADKENNQPEPQASSSEALAPAPEAAASSAPTAPVAPPEPLAPGALPPQIEAMLTVITTTLRDNFATYPPHTIQRLSELIIAPRAHYNHLAPYLHAFDRVSHVTSGKNIFPLPPAIPDVATMTLLSNGVSDPNQPPRPDPATSVAWSNPASTVGSDEALGGALLTPIPWLTRRPSPHGSASSSPGSAHSPQPGQGQHEIRTESTETIDGPNGMGSIETVTVSLNGVSSMTAGSAAAIAAQQQAQQQAQQAAAAQAAAAAAQAANTGSRPITQGELLRQEQQRGVVPISQLARQADEIASHHAQNASAQLAAAQAAAVAAAVGRTGANGAGEPRHQDGGAGDDGDAAEEADAEADGDGDGEGEVATEADRSTVTTTKVTSPSEEAAQADEDDVPHARGPEEIGVDDLGPQTSSTMRFVGSVGAEMQGINVEAAVGRKSEETTQREEDERAHADEAASDAGSETSQKREAEDDLPEGAAVKRRRPSVSPEHGQEDKEGDAVMADDEVPASSDAVDATVNDTAISNS